MFVFQGLLHIKANLYEKEANHNTQRKAQPYIVGCLSQIFLVTGVCKISACVRRLCGLKEPKIRFRANVVNTKIKWLLVYKILWMFWPLNMISLTHKVSSRAFLNLGIGFCYTKHDTFDCKIYTLCEIGSELILNLNCKVPHFLWASGTCDFRTKIQCF